MIATDEHHTQAAPLFPGTNAAHSATEPALARDQVVVTGGFVGSSVDGVTTMPGRGGSDYTASIVGASIGAEEIQIWTDVDGMLTSDSTILRGGPRSSFAREAHTCRPRLRFRIPIRVL